jgi:hypothetical protein
MARKISKPEYKYITNFYTVTLECKFRLGNDILDVEIKVNTNLYLDLSFHHMSQHEDVLFLLDNTVKTYRIEQGYDELIEYKAVLWSPDQDKVWSDGTVEPRNDGI